MLSFLFWQQIGGDCHVDIYLFLDIGCGRYSSVLYLQVVRPVLQSRQLAQTKTRQMQLPGFHFVISHVTFISFLANDIIYHILFFVKQRLQFL